MTQRRSTARGFTLIELLIALAVLGIIAAIAYPSYQSQVRKARRAEAQRVMLDAVARQHQFLLDTRNYAGSVNALGLVAANAIPASMAASYTLTVAATAPNLDAAPAFTVTAAPLGAQVADTCGTLTVDQFNIRTPAGCW